MSEYNEDQADPQMNVDILDREFGVDRSLDAPMAGEIIDVDVQEVTDMRKELHDLENDMPDADQIILDNISRANRILDKIEETISSGGDSARLIEVCGQLINAVTVAATSITGISYNQQVIDNKNRALDIKEKEMTIKGLAKGAENVNITNNNLVMTREDLLKMIDEG